MSEGAVHPLFVAIAEADANAIEALISSGIDPNTRDEYGDPALFEAVQQSDCSDNEDRERYLSTVRRMIDLGAKTDCLGKNGESILIGPILGLRNDMVEFLLQQGVDPNRGCSEPWETVYDAASFDYAYEAFIGPERPYLDRPDELAADEDEYVAWLDGAAKAEGYLRPTILILLRQYGALSGDEMAVRLGGNPGQQVRWKDSGWVLTE